jgi:sulfate adenylyltransferase
MDHTSGSDPHGGDLVNLIVDGSRHDLLKEIAQELPDVILNDRQLCNLELLATGAFSPLTGFMNRSDYESVLDRMRLQNGQLWPLPVCLDIPGTLAGTLEAGQSLAIRDPEGFMLAVMHIEDVWPVDREKEWLHIHGDGLTDDTQVRNYYNGLNDYYVGGELEVTSLPLHFEFKQLRMTPGEVRSIYKKLGWQRVIGFQTRHLIHQPQFEMTVEAMREAKANLLLLPTSGVSKPGDVNFYSRVKCYREVIRHYPPDASLMNILPYAELGGGMREEFLHIILSKNYGCTHCLIEKHARRHGEGDGGKTDRAPADPDGLTHDFSQEVGVDVLPFRDMVYQPFEDIYSPSDQVPSGSRSLFISDVEIQKRIKSGRRVPEWATFPEVAAELQKAYPPPSKQGFTVFLTGFSGAGKSTVAKVLYSRFLEIGGRPVTLLDGDIVRLNLSSELSFSKEHRDINVRRIGFVASEITKNRGIAICAPIAPYTETRREIRAAIESWGGFVEVYMSTPLEICEKRDRKGMYAKARAGLIKGFTGVDDPYEVPESAEVSINTTDLSPDEAAQEILLFLGRRGYI